jgi:hypothetical protein
MDYPRISIPEELQVLLARLVDTQRALELWDTESPGVVGQNRDPLNFTPDGILLGDVGKALSERTFQIRLLNSRRAGCNARLESDGKIAVDIFATRKAAFHFRRVVHRVIALLFSEDGTKVQIAYNGPGKLIVDSLLAGRVTPAGNGTWSTSYQIPVQSSDLLALNVSSGDQIPFRRSRSN